MMSRHQINSDAMVEILVRVILWILFIWLNGAEVFHRHIAVEELWLYKYPIPEKSFVPSSHLWILIMSFPLAIFAFEYLQRGYTHDIRLAISALSLAYGLNGAITSYLKIIVGRPRPDFYYRCFPDGVGNDLSKCTGSESAVLDGRKSFPSGHSSFSFTCMVFMTCYIARKVSLWTSTNGQGWRLCATVIPLVIAISVAVSRTCDYHHHYEDVIFGSLLGTCVGGVTYYLYYRERNNPERVIETR